MIEQKYDLYQVVDLIGTKKFQGSTFSTESQQHKDSRHAMLFFQTWLACDVDNRNEQRISL